MGKELVGGAFGAGGRRRQVAFHLLNCSGAPALLVRRHGRNCFRCLLVPGVGAQDVRLEGSIVGVRRLCD